MQKRTIACGPYRVRVLSWGSGARHAVVLPGMSATYHTLAPQVRLLRRLGYTTHVVELPGFTCGPPLRRQDATFARLAEHLTCTLRQIGVDRALFLGHSLGGGIALHAAMRDRELVDGLIVLAPAALGRSLLWVYKLYSVPVIGRALMRPHRTRSVGYARRFLVGRRRRDDMRFLNFLVRQERPTARKLLAARALVWANQPPAWKKLAMLFVPGGEQCTFTLRARLSELRGIPMLVLWGSDDRVISAGDLAPCRAVLTDARCHVALGVGHMLPLEAPRWTNRHIERFVLERRSAENKPAA